MKTALNALFATLAVLMLGCATSLTPQNQVGPPEWSKNVVWYQIFVERFNNGDTTNDPTASSISTPSASFAVPENWTITPWTSDWYTQEPWAEATGRGLRETMQHRRYGGDIQGILNKLDYLSDLGISAVYLNPINDAPSLHKYDARNYHHIDINFGPDPEGDIAIIATEDPSDPATWKWTSADKLFLKLVDELHKRNIKVIVDYSWNHTGVLFWAWQDLIKNQQKSKYKDWYEVQLFDDPNTPENEFTYRGWLNIMSLPEIKKVNVKGERLPGHPYEGNISEGPKRHIFDVTRRWLAPDGDVSRGIDGYRLDVADHVPMGFWRDYRTFVKSINPEAYLVGEIWWEKWPDSFMDPGPYVNNTIFDGIMHYQLYRPARSFFGKAFPEIDAKQLADGLNNEWSKVDEPYRYSMMNVNATHDTPRLLSDFTNRGKYKFHASPFEDTAYITTKPDLLVRARVCQYVVHQFTNIGSPHIWNGDEFGMLGGDDPDERKPLWWQEFNFSPENTRNIKPGNKIASAVGFDPDIFAFYKKIICIRNQNEVLANGKIKFLLAEGQKLVYTRDNGTDKLFVLFNTGESVYSYNLPEKGKYQDLITGKTFETENIQVKPTEALILNRQK